MTDRDKEIKALYKKAKKFLDSAALLLEKQDYDSSISRIYYGMYYMAKSLLLTKNIKAKTHAGIIQKFGEIFIKTEIFPKTVGKDLSKAFEKRLIGDYEVFKKLEQEEVEKFLIVGKRFVKKLKRYLEQEEGFQFDG